MGDGADLAILYGYPGDTLYEPGGKLSCRYCGTSNLYWINMGTGDSPIWRLGEPTGVVHNCVDFEIQKDIENQWEYMEMGKVARANQERSTYDGHLKI